MPNSKKYIAVGMFVLAFIFSFSLLQRVREHATNPPATDPIDVTASIASSIFSVVAPSGKVISEISETIYQSTAGECKLADPKKLKDITSKECLGKPACAVTIDHTKIGSDTCPNAPGPRVVKVKGKAMSPEDWKKHGVPEGSYKDELFGIVFTDKNYAYAMYAGIGLAILIIIMAVGMSFMRSPRPVVIPAAAPMYGMGRRRR
jgi:hypothetical protein